MLCHRASRRPAARLALACALLLALMIGSAPTAEAGRPPPGPVTPFLLSDPNTQAYSIARGADGNFWFTTGGYIGRMTPAGVVTGEFPIPTANSDPRRIIAGPDGNLWFTERLGNKIGRVTTAGAITEFPILTADSRPWGIAAGPDGNVWFTERLGNKIGRITPNGTITEFPLPNPSSDPWNITAGPGGHLWFTESLRGTVGRITTAGAITEFPRIINLPAAITAGPDGNLWVGDWQSGSVVRVTPSGVVTPTFAATFTITSIAAGPDGNLWAVGQGRLVRVTTAGVATTFDNDLRAFGEDIAVGPGSSLWFPAFGAILRLQLPSFPTTIVPLGPGIVSPGTGTYVSGQVVTFNSTPELGTVFTGWTVGNTPASAATTEALAAAATPNGWANPLTLTIEAEQTIQATFVSAKTFEDVPSGRADYAAITALASRGTILGYSDKQYGPDDGVQRAQMAALIARATAHGPGVPTGGTLAPPACVVAGSWDCEVWGNNFTDQSGDPNLWRNAGTLQHYGVALGYTAGDCAGKGRAFPCYGPTDPVTFAQTVTFITRMMKVKGYWVAQPGAPLPSANVPGPHQEDVRTFAFYTQGLGGIPAPPGDWNAGATRGWFARVLWQALNSYWGTDGNMPDGRPAGGMIP